MVIMIMVTKNPVFADKVDIDFIRTNNSKNKLRWNTMEISFLSTR